MDKKTFAATPCVLSFGGVHLGWMYVFVSALLLVAGLGMVVLSLSSSTGDLSVKTSQPSTLVQKVLNKQLVPGHPLYSPVMGVEYVELVLAQNPVQKAWLLKQRSNSRFLSSLTLYSYNEINMGTSTLNKSIIYLDRALELGFHLSDGDVKQTFLLAVQKDIKYYLSLLPLYSEKMTDSDRSRVDHFLEHLQVMDTGLAGRIGQK